MIHIPKLLIEDVVEEHINEVLPYIVNGIKFFINIIVTIKNARLQCTLNELKVNLGVDKRRYIAELNCIRGSAHKVINIKHDTVIDFDNRKFNNYFISKIDLYHKFFKYLLKNNNKKLKQILKSEPYRLERIYDGLEWNFDEIFFVTNDEKKFVCDLLSIIFNYESVINNKSSKWNGYDLATRLDITVCPYCNRSYIFTVISRDKEIVRPEFDHFYCKSLYPIFSLSFYNLIPSCSICNKKKSNTDFLKKQKGLHPYYEGYGNNAFFTYEIKDLDTFEGEKEAVKVKLQINHDPDGKISINNKVFAISAIYEYHNDIVADLLYRGKTYTKSVIEDIVETLNNGESTKVSEEEVFNLIYNYSSDEDIPKRSLGKLHKDIVDRMKWDVSFFSSAHMSLSKK
ncbi:hypothetical protein [Alkaliphilus transvaalensis]|uniref:hypothetical protein n=1 Tax=Alkaliphilus transvaalensis TaxID=114628 RepID=UPI00047C5149|nr:hypothetical protein [Alkaliphilus transvaalensis]